MKKHTFSALSQTAIVTINSASRLSKRRGTTRRRFIQGATAVPVMAVLSPYVRASANTPAAVSVADSALGFNGERKDPVSGVYHLGAGYRAYSPVLMRFNAVDSMSPFGRGGFNSYAYCLGDPVNRRDPSGHFAILSLLIGAIAGAVVGGTVSAIGEGIRAVATGTRFDWKQVGIGAALGVLSGGFGAAMSGTKSAVKVGLAMSDAIISSATDLGLGVATGSSLKEAGEKAVVGGVVGLLSFGVGSLAGRAMKLKPRQSYTLNQQTIPVRTRTASFTAQTNGSYIDSDFERLTVRAHGAEGVVVLDEGLLSGPELAEVLLARGHRSHRVIKLESCHGADGGTYRSLAQSLSNHTGAKVVGYRGEVGLRQFSDISSPSSRSFTPQSKVRQRFTSFLHRRYANSSKRAIYHRHPAWQGF